MSHAHWTFPPPPPPFSFFIYIPPFFIFGIHFLRSFCRLYRRKKRSFSFLLGLVNKYILLYSLPCFVYMFSINMFNDSIWWGFYSLRGFCICFGLVLLVWFYSVFCFLFYTYIACQYFLVFLFLRFFNFFWFLFFSFFYFFWFLLFFVVCFISSWLVLLFFYFSFNFLLHFSFFLLY